MKRTFKGPACETPKETTSIKAYRSYARSQAVASESICAESRI